VRQSGMLTDRPLRPATLKWELKQQTQCPKYRAKDGLGTSSTEVSCFRSVAGDDVGVERVGLDAGLSADGVDEDAAFFELSEL